MFKVIFHNDQLLYTTIAMALFMIGYTTTTSFGLYYFKYAYGDESMYSIFALLAYITLIFIVMMLVAAVFPKEKSDKIVEKWENWKISRKEKKAERQQKPDKESKSDTEAADSLKQQEPVLKNIFIKRFSLKKANDINDAEEPEESNLQETPAEETAVFIPESLESLENEPEVFTDTANDEIITDQAQEVQTEGSDEAGKEREPETIPYDEQEPETMTYEEREPETMPYDEQEPEIVPYEEQETETVLYEGPETEEKQETESDMELPDGAVYSDQHEDSQGFLYEKEENTEKNVDTSDIIDKMGLDTISDFIELSSDRLSIDEVLDRAFLLKQEGKELEAASLFINALDMKPDTEVAFWIVLDICVIYKNFGQSELAADILQAYMNEYNDLMSDEVKEQILQSLYF
jgi:hypothetical protein